MFVKKLYDIISIRFSVLTLYEAMLSSYVLSSKRYKILCTCNKNFFEGCS